MEKDKKLSPKTSFEDALQDLEDVANKLEGGELGLDDSIKEFEKGIKLARYCQQKLEEAERKIEILQKGADGEVKPGRVAVKPDTGEIEDEDDLQGSLI
ncbi:MAG TPA: exodeoxyribonuclease VII small subunit [Spirochaetota bacterium]|nr:exodeoxyribonuclease VII small subunit [Spirochaetota bacterium]HPS87193.1 exodeoxyribonuclease VII small subunit [Spirochaetota bacterium]